MVDMSCMDCSLGTHVGFPMLHSGETGRNGHTGRVCLVSFTQGLAFRETRGTIKAITNRELSA